MTSVCQGEGGLLHWHKTAQQAHRILFPWGWQALRTPWVFRKTWHVVTAPQTLRNQIWGELQKRSHQCRRNKHQESTVRKQTPRTQLFVSITAHLLEAQPWPLHNFAKCHSHSTSPTGGRGSGSGRGGPTPPTQGTDTCSAWILMVGVLVCVESRWRAGRTLTWGRQVNPRTASMWRPNSWSWGKKCPCSGPKSTLGQSGEARRALPPPWFFAARIREVHRKSDLQSCRVLDVGGFDEDAPVAPRTTAA